MKLTQNQILGGIILTAIAFAAGGVIAFNNAEADLSDQEVINIVERYMKTDEGREYLMQQIIRSDVWNAHVLEFKDSIAAPHTQYASVEDYNILQEQIFQIRGDMVRKHPTTPAEDPINEDRKLTVTLVNDIIFLGQSIVIKGNGEPNRPVFAFASAPNRSIEGATVADDNGFWLIDIKTDFSDTIGTWSIRVTQDQYRAEPIMITVR